MQLFGIQHSSWEMILTRYPPVHSLPTRVNHRQYQKLLYSTKGTTPLSHATAVAKRLPRIQARLPKFIQHYTVPLVDAPVTHVTSFVILHEITAVVPLFTLAGIFHYTGWIPTFVGEGKWIAAGMEKFGKYFRKKGWLGEVGEDGKHLKKRGIWWGRGEKGSRLIIE